jgi:hypothetical protein
MKVKPQTILLILCLGIVPLISAFAPPIPMTEPSTGPYDGLYFGWIYGDRDSKAPIALKLKHVGQEVTGRLYLGEGLYIDGGRCGSAAVPPTSVSASGLTDPENPNELSASSTVNIGGFSVRIDLDSILIGDRIEANAIADLPWLCGVDPQVSAKLDRVNQEQ